MKTFNWKMNMGASASVHHAVSKTQFGDGYAQRVSVGINNQRTDWSGSKTGDWQTVILPIKTFLDEHKGVIPFLWTNPHGQTKKYVCENYEISQKKGNFWEISLKFEQSNSDGSSVPLLDFSNQNSGTSTPNLPQSALDDINKKIQDEIERSTQKDDAHDKAIQSLNTSKTSLSKSIDEIKEQLAGVSSAPASVTWDSITGKPSSFNPSSHSHTISDISGLQSLLNAKVNSNHSHTWNSITNKPANFTPSAHTHQASDIADLHTILSKYATKDEIPQINTDGLTIDTSNLATKTSVETLANKVTEASEALKSETKLRANSIAAIDSKIDDEIASLKRTKADLSHTHTMSEVTDLSAELERYALKTELNNISVDTSHLATKSSVNELSEQIATKADQSHRHAIGDITNLQRELDNKANSNHSHAWNSITDKPTTLAGYGITDAISSDTTAFVTSDALNRALTTKASINHQHTITEVSGLQGILNNKLNSNASARSAQKLTTPRRINGIAFDGTQDITLPTPTANVSWSAISNKPTNFTPSSHRHAIGDITNLQRELDNKASRNHSHTWNSITNKPANFTPSAHTHQWSNISNVPSATINNAGIVQLSNNTNGVRQTIAATEFALNEVRKLINSSSRRGSITGVLNRQSHRYFYQRRHGTSSTDAVYSDIDTFTFPDGRIVYLVRLEGIKPAFFDVNTTSVGGSDHTPAKIINLPTAMPNKIISAIPQITSSSLGNTLSSCIVGWDWTYNIDPISGNTRSKSQVRIQFSGYQGNTTNNKIDLSIIVEGY
ncbi:phage tail protein [Moraxella catarrhalis]|uniref:phage tail protein n=1 Tax=Moraxella catarrhalis TaxID=480 RepID=UPI001F90C48A|nr:phage tail protein [Moraxella catarrhalis]MCG6816998.1 phage tail protein [Moraxella catarrhalis]